MRLGMFDGEPSSNTNGKLGPDNVCTCSHKNLALQAARQGIVLLKNDDHVLPLSRKEYTSVAVIGPHSDATFAMIGNYAGVPCGYTSPLRGIGMYTKTVPYFVTKIRLFGVDIDVSINGEEEQTQEIEFCKLLKSPHAVSKYWLHLYNPKSNHKKREKLVRKKRSMKRRGPEIHEAHPVIPSPLLRLIEARQGAS